MRSSSSLPHHIRIISLIGFCLLAPGCGDRGPAPVNESNRNDAAQAANSNAPANRNASADAGRDGAEEPGDTSEPDFEGTAGIVERRRPASPPALLREVRTARHPGFDRVVFEFAGGSVPGYHVEYIDRPVRQCGSGEAVPVAGDAWLLVRFSPSNAHTDSGQPTVAERERHPGLPNLKELELICDFEAEVSWVLGLSSPNRYRVLELKDPARLAVDVKH